MCVQLRGVVTRGEERCGDEKRGVVMRRDE